ncbi:hypothetical protein PRIPAC_79108 [Pristionchus pacificus]|uniref:Uncharacterized protein n=1 Tax=Pristionchus pacificus TaxID=54126 RepID=A0A2A6C2G9_PRIPA|nr:hypothetical protein PRIPAC_79108 [Pristionchus pacificus]|eukprot:PDM72340.1 hypothetical protein PRIPAC_38774 [Pristionchus pacificus]
MAVSLCAESAKIIVATEGTLFWFIEEITMDVSAMLGVILNITLLILLCILDIGRTAKVYRISCIITTVSSLYTSLLLLIEQNVFILINGNVANVLYGSILFYLPERVNDWLTIAFFTQAHTMWQAEFKFSRKVIVRLLALPVLFYCNAWVLAHTASFQNKFLQYYMLYSVPDKAFRNEMVNSIFELHGTDLKDYCFKQQTCVPIIFVSKFSRERNVRTSKSKFNHEHFVGTYCAITLIGIVLNNALLILLCRINIGKLARIYHISSMITAFLGLYTSFLLFIVQDVFMLVNGNVATVLFGPFLFYLPDKINEMLKIAFFTQAYTIPKSSAVFRLLSAYIIAMIFYMNAMCYMRFAIPDKSLKNEILQSVLELPGYESRNFHKGNDFLNVLLYDAIPSYIASYGMYIYSAVKVGQRDKLYVCYLLIRSHLLKVGDVASAMGTTMQRRFFRLHIAQVLMPLMMLSPMIGVILLVTVHGAILNNLSLIIVFRLWLSPSLTVSKKMIMYNRWSSGIPTSCICGHFSKKNRL